MRLADFQTERLTICHWAEQLDTREGKMRVERDLQSILTPEVLCHLPPSLQLGNTLSAVSTWVEARAAESDVYLIMIRAPAGDTGRLVGVLILVDLSKDDDEAQFHLGYLLAEQHWGQGFASEMVQGLVEVMRQLGPLSVLGGVSVDNPASAKILTRAGFVKDADLSTPDTDMFVLSLC